MKITTYQSTQAGSKQWLAHMNLGNCYMDFFAVTEADAVAKAQQFYDREKARQLVIHGAASELAPTQIERTSIEPCGQDYGSGRGVHFVGKVWMLNR